MLRSEPHQGRRLAEPALGHERAERRFGPEGHEQQRGELLIWMGRPDEGAEWVESAMHLDPYCASTWSHTLGRALLQLERFEDALRAYRTCPVDRYGQRADLAALVVECLDDDSTIGRIYHTIDPEIQEQPPLQRGEAPKPGVEKP